MEAPALSDRRELVNAAPRPLQPFTAKDIFCFTQKLICADAEQAAAAAEGRPQEEKGEGGNRGRIRCSSTGCTVCRRSRKKARRPAEEQAERGAARTARSRSGFALTTAALFSQAISQEIESGREEKAAARARADPAGQREAEGIPSHFCLLLSFVCCSQKSIAEAQRNKSLCFSTQYCLKRNTRAAATTAGEQGEAATRAAAKEGGKRENKAAGAHAAACVLVLTAEAGIFFACGEH